MKDPRIKRFLIVQFVIVIIFLGVNINYTNYANEKLLNKISEEAVEPFLQRLSEIGVSLDEAETERERKVTNKKNAPRTFVGTERNVDGEKIKEIAFEIEEDGQMKDVVIYYYLPAETTFEHMKNEVYETLNAIELLDFNDEVITFVQESYEKAKENDNLDEYGNYESSIRGGISIGEISIYPSFNYDTSEYYDDEYRLSLHIYY